MADRMHGAEAIAMRGRDVPHAYRVFFRHVGLDPDVVRTPIEAVVLRRMSEGGLRPQGLVADALTVAVLETGVGVQAFDGVVGAPRIEEADGRLVIADEQGPLAVLFGEPNGRHRPRPPGGWRWWRSQCRAWPTWSSRRRCGRPGTSCARRPRRTSTAAGWGGSGMPRFVHLGSPGGAGCTF